MKDTIDSFLEFLKGRTWFEIIWCFISIIFTVSFFADDCIEVTSNIWPIWYFWNSKDPIKLHNALFILWILCSICTIILEILKALFIDLLGYVREKIDKRMVHPKIDTSRNNNEQ